MGTNSQKVVCIFNKDRLSNALGNKLYESSFRKTYMLNNKKVFLSESNISFDEPFNGWEILLHADNYVDFTDKDIFNENTLVMHHTTPANSVDGLSKTNVIKYKQGKHENKVEDGYTLLKYLISAWNEKENKFKPKEYEEAKQKLIDWFGLKEKLNAALEFLHKCLAGDMQDLPNNFSSCEKHFNTWKTNQSIDGLSDLRDVMLKEVGVDL